MDDGDHKLHCFWNNYVSSERDVDEKRTWLDLFLAQFLLDFQKSKKVPEKLNSNVADSIAKEFIVEVHNACTKSDESDELAPLKKYLLNGRGWRCLAVLRLLDKSKLSNAYELSHLLVSLFALVDYEDCLNCVKSNSYLTDFEQKNIDDIVREKLNVIKRKSRSSYRRRNSKEGCSKHNKSDNQSSCDAHTAKPEASASSIVANSVKLLPFPHFIFGRNRSEDETASADPVPQVIDSQDALTLERLKSDVVAEVLDSSVNNAEFRLLVLSELQRLCEEDHLSGDEYEDVVGAVFKFALENLCAIQYRFSKHHGDASIEQIKSHLTHLLITCANGTKRCKRITNTLSQNGIVQIFLQLLQEVASSVTNGVRDQRSLTFLYSLTYCILILFFQILRQDSVSKNLTTFNKLYRQFIGCASGRLLEGIVRTFLSTPNVDRGLSLKRIKIIVTFCGLLIVRFKSLRRRVVNVDEEEAAAGGALDSSSHHDNLFGKPFKSIILCPTALHENCCISSTFVVLLRLVLADFDTTVTATVLRILVYCGTCCCVPVVWFLTKVWQMFPRQPVYVRQLMLLFLERKFYADVGLFKGEHCMSCVIVNKTDDQWPCLEELKTLLSDEDADTVQLVGNHLLKVFGNFAFEVRQYFVCQVLRTVFEQTRQAYTSSKGARGKDCMLVCLAVFGDMSAYKLFANECDEILATKAIRELLLDTNFTELCCRVLETRIIHKTSHIECGNSFTPVLADSCTIELNVLLKIFDECYDDIMRLICFKEEQEEQLLLETKNGDADALDKRNGNVLLHLKMITCTLERLTVRSSVIKSFFHSHAVKMKFQKLLFLVLRILAQDDVLLRVDPSPDLNVDDIRLKLTQPLLIICLSLFDDTNAIEDRVKELLHTALQAGKISIKQVCDSLLSLEQVQNVHKESLDNWNNAASTATLIYTENSSYSDNSTGGSDADEDVLSWSQVENALSDTSDEDGHQLVLLLDSYSKSTLLYPMVCTIAIDLINALRVDQCTEEALYVLQHISAICQRNSDICIELTKQNMISRLLDKLESSLAEELLTPEETDVQFAITQFISVLFCHRVERLDLMRFLNFLKIPRAPYDHLIGTLVSVVDATVYQVQPAYYVSFPAPTNELNVEFDEPAEALAVSMREMQKHTTTTSPWVICGLALPLNTNLDWSIWITGFSTSFWLKYEPPSVDPSRLDHSDDDEAYEGPEANMHNGLVHVISVGYDTLLLEAWIDENTSCFTLRLTRPEGSSFEILSQVTFQKALDDSAWHNIVLNVRDTMKQQKIALEVTLLVDGLYEETRYLIFVGIFIRKVRPSCIMLGETRSLIRGRYSLGNLMMFRAAVLDKECCQIIRAFGPDFENVVLCSANSLRPNFAHFMSSEHQALPKEFSVAKLTRGYDENMKRMQENLLVSYTPRKTDNFYHYMQTDTTSNAVSVSVFPPSTPTLFKKSRNSRSYQRIPHATRAVIFADVTAHHRKTFYDCVHELGGFSFLAYLFAKLVDSCQNETVQCDALRIVLKSCFTDVRLYSQFCTFNGYNLVAKVITSPRSRIARLAFVELTNVICSRKNYFLVPENDMPGITDTFICNAEIIVSMLIPYWWFWEKNDGGDLLTSLFRGLHSMLLATNVYKQLNLEQLTSVNAVERTLDMCKEKFVFHDTDGQNNDELCSAILEFIKIMIGTPPSTDNIRSIIDYLYVVQPNSHSFCVQSPNSFYFLFSSLSQTKPKQHRASETASTLVTENPLTDDHDDHDEVDACLEEPLASAEELNGRISYARTLSKSLTELHEDKGEMIDDYLQSSNAFNLSKSDEEEEKVDSGIAGSNTTDEPSELFSCSSASCLMTEPSDTGFIRRYSAFNFPSTPDANLLAKHLGTGTENDCDQYIITAGLLNIVHDTVLVLPDSSIAKIFNKIIDYKLFVIMANHPNASVRNTVVKTVLAWLMRCEEEAQLRFVSHVKGFYHLANQLAMYPATEELVNSCISLMARCRWEALDQVAEMDEKTLPTLHFSAAPPLLAIFPGTVHNFRLALNVIQFFKVLVTRVPLALKKLIEHGLVESLVKTVLVLIHGEENDENVILLNEIIDLFALIISSCVQTPGVQYLQILNEIVYKCRYLEVTEEALCGPEEPCVQIIHNLHCSVLQAGLDTVLSLIDLYHSQDMVKGRRSPSFITTMTGSMSASLSSIPSSIMSFASPAIKQKQLPRSEVIDRYKLIINRATEYLQFSSSSVITKKDMKFSCHLFSTLINGVSNIVHNKPYIRIGSPWSSIYWSARETLRTQASNLLIWMLAPVRSVHLRLFAIDTLLNEPRAKEIVSTLVFINVETESRFAIFLWHLMYSKVCDLEEAEMQMCEDFKNSLQEWEIISPQAIGQAHDRWQFEVSSALRELSVVYWSLEKSQQNAVYKSVYKMENLSKKLTEIATSISEAVCERQGRERKKLLNGMREKYRLHVEARSRWRNIVQQMTHERAPWYDVESYPDSWELDPTEGPHRIRKRLRRTKLNINKKFFKPEHTNKSKTNDDYPLSYLFENNDLQTLYTAALDSLSMDDTISFMCCAMNVQPEYEVDGELLVGGKYLYYIATRIKTRNKTRNVTIAEADKFSLIVKFSEIKEIHNRRFQLKECAVELFLLNGRTVLIAFNTPMDRDKFISALNECSLPNRILNDMLLNDAVDRWKEGHSSNWEYLKILNKMAGRSYNDLMQYPVMPFILADYTSDTIDLRENSIYRNLKRPMAVQDKKKEQYFINHYNYLKNECINNRNGGASIKQQPYHFASHYSNSGTVLHFLLRLPPYTQIFLEYQDNNFDLPDRTFHSLDTTWRLTSSESTSDVKELIPEFFCLPEFLLNSQGFNFGVRQNGEIVDDVKLPSWTRGDARLFVLVHRQILESEYVRENLPHWVDLVFGHKQTGKAAVDAINVFHPATYYGFDVDNIPDQLEREAWETMVKTYGQTPRQLFRNPHPMIVQNLTPDEEAINIPVIQAVKGLKWGNYVGSPAKPSPTIVWNSYHTCPVTYLIPLITNDVFGLPEYTSLLLSYNKERSINLVNEGVTLTGAALLSWNHDDGVVRIKERKEQPHSPIIFCPPKDPITVCSTVPDCSLIWIGLSSGNILVFRYTFGPSSTNGGVTVEPEPTILVGHGARVNQIAISRAFGVAVSTSDDHEAIIWDLNEVAYVRTIASANLPVTLVTISSTLGDVATVCEAKEYSMLRLHTINAVPIGNVNTNERITAVCFSTAPEGVSVNVVAAGLENGVIKLWSTWDLTPVMDIINTTISCPIIALVYSYDAQHMYASTRDGNVYIWEASPSNGMIKTPKFLNLTAIN